MKRFKKEDYIVICAEFECSLHKIETDEQLEQAELDSNINLYTGTETQAKEIIELQRMMNNLDEEDSERIELLKSNIRMMCLRELKNEK